MTLCGLEQGQDLENRAAYPYQEFPGVPPGHCFYPGSLTTKNCFKFFAFLQKDIGLVGVSCLREVKTNDTEVKNKALVNIKAGLQSVKVSRVDATQVQREIEGELFNEWHEGCEVRR